VTKIKFCGITNLDDAELAVAANAWAIGLIFWPGSRRRCEVPAAAEIAAAVKRRVEVVGVFVNATLDHVGEMAEAVGLTMVQLHGDEGPSYCAEVARRTGCKVIKAVRVRSGADVRGLRAFHTDYHLLDSYTPGIPGGTGETFAWDIARGNLVPAHPVPVILSGGLTPENVAEAIETVGPGAVDVASGTERAPGKKDPEKLQAFARSVAGAHAPPGRRAHARAGTPSGT
jgi:phosphoribosylanthranilate isomerase